MSEGFAHRNKDDGIGIHAPKVLDGKAWVYITAASSDGSHPFGVELQAMPAYKRRLAWRLRVVLAEHPQLDASVLL